MKRAVSAPPSMPLERCPMPKKPIKITGRDFVSQLYRAVARYVESNGGVIVAIGGIQIQEWPDDGKFKFTVAVKCAGKRPVFEKGKSHA
jgi:hypothetical protein